MKKLCLAFVAVVALLIPAGGYADPVISTVRVSVHQLDNDTGFGSGVVIAPGIVLTAHHVALGPALRFDKGRIRSETVALGNGDPLDLAIIRFPISEAPCPCARLADYPAMLDEQVWLVGFPANVAQVVTAGTAQGTHDVTVWTPYGPERLGNRLVLAAAVIGGNSGGGVFVRRNGEFQLVGILVEGMGPLAFAIPLQDIKAFIAKHQSKF